MCLLTEGLGPIRSRIQAPPVAQLDCEHDSPAYRGRSAARWVPVGDGLTHKWTDRRSWRLNCRSSSVGDGPGNPSDRMGRDPIGACGNVAPSQSCPPIRPTHQPPRRPPGDEPQDDPA